MEFLKRLLPAYTPVSIAAKGGLAVLREKVLQSFLIGLFILGIPAIGLAVVQSLQAGQSLLSAFYVVIFIWISLALVKREWPFLLRTGTVLLIAYILGVSQLWDSGSLGEVRLWLLIFVVLSAIFTNLWISLGSAVLSAVTIFLMGRLLEVGAISTPFKDIFFQGTPYVQSGVISLMISVGIVVSISALFSGLARVLKEREEMTDSLQKERLDLENRIEERTADLQVRLKQMNTAAEIVRAISGLSDPEAIFQRVAELINTQLGLYYTGIFLLDQAGKNAILRAGTGEAGKAMLSQHHALPVGGTSMIGWCMANRQARIALDVGNEAVRFNNPFLPLTRSELALPIMSRDMAVGAITIQSQEAQAFDENDIIILQGIADSLAIAVENSRLYRELERNLEEVRVLNRNYVQQVWSEALDESGQISAIYTSDDRNRDLGGNLTSLPISLREQVIGHLTLDLTEEALTQEDMAFIDALTTQTALALENARLVQETERRAIQEQKLNAFSNRFNRARDVENILRAAVEEFGQLPAVVEATIQLLPASAYDLSADSDQPGNNGKEKAL
ncbi:MAG: GAF domain-containing protein [Anaerolineaceae bacterium]|nr:GAF domain-containing protein [Anaerolineaceae bacterium]